MLNTKSTDCETHSVPVGQFDTQPHKVPSLHFDAVMTLKPVPFTRVALAIHYDSCGHLILFTSIERVKFTEVINITRTSSAGCP